ncbi:hypothetical protein CsatB_013248 [Cannabis sativa]
MEARTEIIDRIITDWRRIPGVLTPVRNQQKLKCCWAITAESCVSCCYNLLQPQPQQQTILSCQQLIDFSWPAAKIESGHQVPIALNYIREHGITTEQEYPFVGKKQNMIDSLQAPQFQDLFYINGYECVRSEERMSELLKLHPLVVGGRFEHNFKEKFGDWSIYFPSNDWSLKENDWQYWYGSHAMLIVGEGTEIITIYYPKKGKRKTKPERKEIHYWIVQNSWGSEWGLNGLGRIVKDQSFLELMVWSPIL